MLLAACGRIHFDPSDAEHACVRALTAYGDQACAIRDDDALYCWGSNTDGQLGDGGGTDHLVPSPVTISDVASVASGEDTVCAIRGDGTVWCWGFNLQGQVGDGSLVNQSLPVHIALQAGASQVVAAQTHTCAVLADATGWCWGSNAYGELGYPMPTMEPTPQSSPVAGQRALALGDNVTCALRTDSTVACFGRDDEGELGDGMTTSRFFAMRVAAIADPVVSLAGGCHRHFCAATALGDVWCWGENQHGELGTGFASQLESTPAHVAGVPSAVQVTVGAFHSCARTTAGEVWCWGDNTNGQLGDGSFEASFTPVRVAGITGTPIDLEASCSDTFVLRDDKSLLAWGAAVQLGTGDTLNSPEPVEVAMPCP